MDLKSNSNKGQNRFKLIQIGDFKYSADLCTRKDIKDYFSISYLTKSLMLNNYKLRVK